MNFTAFYQNNTCYHEHVMADSAHEHTAGKWITFEDDLAASPVGAFTCWAMVSELPGRPIHQLYVRRPDKKHWWVFGENDAPQMVDGMLPRLARQTVEGPIIEGPLSVLVPHDADPTFPDVGRALAMIKGKISRTANGW